MFYVYNGCEKHVYFSNFKTLEHFALSCGQWVFLQAEFRHQLLQQMNDAAAVRAELQRLSVDEKMIGRVPDSLLHRQQTLASINQVSFVGKDKPAKDLQFYSISVDCLV